MAKPRALDGMVVLDCTQFMAGPYCTMLLGDMGADIIKIERPGGGDDARRMGPPFIGGESAAHLQINRNKRSIVLDIRSDKGNETIKRLAARSDVMIENFRPGTMERRGLGYEDIKKINPQIIYCSISGFGLTGPYAQRPGFDMVTQGMSGHMSITGVPDGPPVRVGVPICDLNAGIYAAYGILAAYTHRLRTGQGQFLEVSLLESAIAYQIWEGARYFATGESPGPGGSTHRLVAPYQAFQAKDGHVILAAGNQQTWERAAKAMGREDLLEDERFTDNPTRIVHRAELEAELENTFTTETCDHWLDLFEKSGVPAGPIFNLEQMWSNEQVQARGMDVTLEHPTAGTIHNIGLPARLSETPGKIERYAPLLGEHTDEVLEFAGYSDSEVAAMKQEGIVQSYSGSAD